MLDFKGLYSINAEDHKKFETMILESDPQYHFLLMFTAFMQQAFLHLNHHIKAHNSPIVHWFNQPLLRQLVFDKYKKDINPMIIRACVWEMHLARHKKLLKGKKAEDRFNYFLGQLCIPKNTGDFLKKYKVIKKQLIIAMEQFCNAMTELFDRLCKDKQELTTNFLHSEKVVITAIHCSGDVHQQGRNVAILTFSNSKQEAIKIIYKPHSLAMDVAFKRFILWFNQYAPQSKALKVTIIFDHQDYGWCEYIEYRACKNETEIKTFYYRLGMWLMLIYLFRGSDIHGDNLIAHGSYPIVVDFECLLGPVYSFLDKKKQPLPWFNVSATLFLPAQIVLDKDHKGLDVSALGYDPGGEGTIPLIDWKDVGKDSMYAERTRKRIAGVLNKPMFNNKTVDYLSYENDFIHGFARAYKIILNQKQTLLSSSSPIKPFKTVKSRLVVCRTSYYFHYLYESWHPKFLVRNKERLRFLNTIAANTKKTHSFRRVLRAELRDLQQNNIPYFSVFANKKELFDSRGEAIDSPITMTGWEALINHLEQNIQPKDLLLQQIFIRNSFSISRANKNPAPIFHLPKQHSKEMSDKDLRRHAHYYAKRTLDSLAQHAFFIADHLYWPSSKKTDLGHWVMELTSLSDFSKGLPGIALTYLYAARLYSNKQYADLSIQGIHTLKSALSAVSLNKIPLMGAYSGGGLLYTLAAFYRGNQDRQLKKLLKGCLRALPEQMSRDSEFTIQEGSAGTLIMLLNLMDIMSEEMIMPLITQGVDHIISQYPLPSSGLEETKPRLGMAKGVGGIAWALQQCLPIIRKNKLAEKKLSEWIKAALHYERSQYLLVKKGELDISWYQGLAGMGLTRVGMLPFCNDPLIRQDLLWAIKHILQEEPTGNISFGSGSLGSLELLFSAGQTLNSPKLLGHFRNIASRMFIALEKHYPCVEVLASATPGLLEGRAGVAYELMRLAHPREVPSILLIQRSNSKD